MSLSTTYNLAIVITEMRRGQAMRDAARDAMLLDTATNQQTAGAGRAATMAGRLRGAWGSLGQAAKNLLIPGVIAATGAIVGLAVKGTKEWIPFDEKMRESFTLLPGMSQKAMDQMTDDIRRLGVEYGRMPEETLPALYQALSLGIPEANVIDELEIAAKAARAGVADLTQTLVTGQSIQNAYGSQISGLSEIYDILFTTVKYGKVTFRELNEDFANVTAIASDVGVELNDVATVVAHMTRQGYSANETYEITTLLLQQLATDGTAADEAFREAAGVGFRQFIDAGGDFISAMALMDQHAQDTHQSMTTLVGGDSNFFRDIRAAQGAMVLTGDAMQELIDLSGEFQDTTGASAEAFSTMAESQQQNINELSAAWKDLKLEIGKEITERGIWRRSTAALKDIMKLLSGGFGRALKDSIGDMDVLNMSIAEMSSLYNRFMNNQGAIGFFDDWDDYTAIMDEMVTQIALASNSEEEFTKVLYENGMAVKDNMGKNQDLIAHSHAAVEYIWDQTEATREANREADRGAGKWLTYWKTVKRPDDTDPAADSKLTAEALAEEAAAVAAAEAAYEEWYDQRFGQGAQDRLAAIINPQASETVQGYIDTLWNLVEEQADAFDALEEAEAPQLVNLAANIASAQERLRADLTDEERKYFEDMLRTVEEGGAEWVAAYNRLQEDMTESERNSLVARLANMQAQQEMGSVYTYDAEAAEDARDRIDQATKDMAEAYANLGQEIIANKFAEVMGTGSYAAAEALARVNLEMGYIDQDQYDLFATQIENARTLEGVLNTVMDEYISESDQMITATEAEAIATAWKTVLENTGESYETQMSLIGEQIPAFSDWYDAMHEGGPIEGVEELQGKLETMIEEGPYNPEVALTEEEMATFWEVTTNMLETLGTLEGPWDIIMNVFTNGEVPDSPPASKGAPPPTKSPSKPPPKKQPQGDQQFAAGAYDFRVPQGYPNDTYTVGLTSGEYVNVTKSPLLANGNQPQTLYQDQRQQNLTIINHTAAAAHVAQARLEELIRSRHNKFMESNL